MRDYARLFCTDSHVREETYTDKMERARLEEVPAREAALKLVSNLRAVSYMPLSFGSTPTIFESGDMAYIENVDIPYGCLWRLHPPASEGGHWHMELWMLPERNRNLSSSDSAVLLAVNLLAATSPPYRAADFLVPLDSDDNYTQVWQHCWSAIDIARACRKLEFLLSSRISDLPPVTVIDKRRTPDDEIIWMTGTLGRNPFTYRQISGSRYEATLEVTDSVTNTVMKVAAPLASGWYGNEVMVETFSALVTRMRQSGEVSGVLSCGLS